MSNPKENFNQFLLYLKTHELKAPTFSASNHYFIKNTGEPNTTFEPMETDEFVPSKINFLASRFQMIILSKTQTQKMSM